MPPITVLLLCHKLPSLNPAQFKSYCEEHHVPLVQSLLGADHPQSHSRYYTNKDAGYEMGSVAADDPDLVAVVTYEDEDTMQRSMARRMADGIREQIQADEDQFMERGRLRVIRIPEGDVGISSRLK